MKELPEPIVRVLKDLHDRIQRHRDMAEACGNLHAEARAVCHIKANECSDIALAVLAPFLEPSGSPNEGGDT